MIWSGDPDAPVILYLHGLEGSIDSSYVRGLMKLLVGRGYRCCLMHFRGCGGIPNRLAESYHSGKTQDVQQVVDILRAEHELEFYAAAGVSLGGNVLLKWLGEQGGESRLQRAAVMSVPFRLEQAAARMNQGFSRLYQQYLLKQLRRSYMNKFATMVSPLEVNVDELDSFWQFDDQVTAALHGFENVHDYYQQSSSRQYVAQIKVPTLILHAADDPFMYPHTVPSPEELPANVWLELTCKGGHVGFVSGNVPGCAHYWGEQRLVQWLDDASNG